MQLEITIVTIEAGWKLATLLTKFSIGPGNFAYSVTGPKDMVDTVIAKSKDVKDLVQRLNIVGHGNAKGIQIGGHFVERSNLHDYETDLRRLRSVMSGESYIHLMGCVVGQDESFLVGLASLTGVPVYAGSSAENALLGFNFGDYVKAYPGGSVQRDVPRPPHLGV